MSLTRVIAEFVVRADARAIPPGTYEHARSAIADGVACTLAGAVTDAGRIVADLVAANGTGQSATLLGFGRRASAPDAALVNGTAGHALDYDDVNWSMYGHPTVPILPAALAVAEAEGRTGRDLVAAYVVGVEVAGKVARWANPRHYESGWHGTSTLGVLGAAAAAARLYGLTVGQTVMALSLAASQAAGVRRNFGTMTKPFHAGNAARGGVVAAQLARAGFTADADALGGRFGYFETLQARALPSPAEMAASLGRPWEVDDPGIVLKVYPSCACTHCALDAMLELRAAHRPRPEDVASIDCAVHPLALKVLQHARPSTGLEGKFSMEFCLAVALIDGPPGLRHFTDAWCRDARVQALLPRIKVEPRADLAAGGLADGAPAEITLVTTDGRRASAKVSVPAGDPRNPMPAAARRAKFAECAAYVLDEAAVHAARAALERLDSVGDLGPLLGVLRAEPAPRTALRAAGD